VTIWGDFLTEGCLFLFKRREREKTNLFVDFGSNYGWVC